MTKSWSTPPREALRVGPGFDLSAVDASSTPGWEHGRSSAENKLEADGNRLSEVQERLYAHGRTGGSRAVLLVLQGMDTAGQGRDRPARAGHGRPAGRAAALVRRARPRRSGRSTTCSGSARRCPPAGASACSTARTTRTCSWSASTSWCRARCGSRGTTRSTRSSGGRRLGHRDRQGRAAGVAGGAEGPAAGAAGAPGQVLEVQPEATSTSAPSGRRTRRRTRRSWTGRAPSTRRGTSSPPTPSGTRGWPSAPCVLDAVEGLDLGWPPADFDVEAEKARLDAQPF